MSSLGRAFRTCASFGALFAARAPLVLFAASVFAAVVACKVKEEPASAPSASVAEKGPAAPAPQHFGAPFGSGPVEPLERVLSAPEQFASGPVTVEGEVRQACTRKGCWMELATARDPKAPGCRVSFKDYGFFVPTDSAGSKARVQASVQVSTVKASHVAHMEEEGATFLDKAADGSAREVRLVATSVDLWRP